MSTRAQIYDTIAATLLTPVSEITDKVGPGDLPTWDSIGQIQLVAKLEEDFGLNFSIDDVMSMNSVGDIVRIISRHRGETAPVTFEPAMAAASVPAPEAISTSEPTPAQSPSRTTIRGNAIRTPATVFWGEGSLATVAQLVTGSAVAIIGSSAYSKEIESQLKGWLGNSVTIASRPTGEPTLSGIQQLANTLRAVAPRTIIAIGGGSTLDIAKLAWALYENPGRSLAEFMVPFSLPPFSSGIQFIAVPTTFGSGSEASSAATFTDIHATQKSILVSHDLLPHTVILDSSLGRNLPLATLASCGFDALTHAVEGAVSRIENPLMTTYAESAIRRLISGLTAVIAKRTLSPQILDDLCYGSYLAGIVQNHCSVGLTHAIAHQLSGYSVSHGIANTNLLVPVIAFNRSLGSTGYDTIAHACGYPTADAMIAQWTILINQAGLQIPADVRLKLIADRSIIAAGAIKDITFRSNPVHPTQAQLESFIADTFKLV